MRKIGTKLILSFSLIVIFSVLLVAAPIVKNEIAEVTDEVRELATSQMATASVSVSAFLEKPARMVKDIAFYASRSTLELKRAQDDFEWLIKDEPAVQALYYADEVPMNQGGYFYFSGGWMPDSSYDKYSRGWFTSARDTDKTHLTDPYIDSATGGLVISLCHRVLHDDGSFAGVVGVDIGLETLESVVNAIKLTPKGKSYIIDKDGLFLTNEDSSKIQNANFFDEYRIVYSANSQNDAIHEELNHFLENKDEPAHYAIFGELVNV